MPVIFSTSEVHPRDRLDYWNEVATKGFVRHEFSTSLGTEYEGHVRLSCLGGLGIAEYECDPGEILRKPELISGSDNDDLLLCIQLAGRSGAAQDGRRIPVHVGSLCMLDPRRPFIASMHTRIKSVIVQVPRRRLEVRVGPVAGLTALEMDPTRPLPALTANFIAMLPACIDTLDGIGASKLAEQMLDLIALTFSAETDKRVAALSSPRACALLRLKSEIEARINDPELTPAKVTEAAGISIRYANSLLATEDTSLERYILARRLERCRRALDDPEQARRSIGEIAFDSGFSDLSHFARRFKAAFGRSPSDYRRRRA